MKKILSVLFTGLILMSCSAAHNDKVREKIAKEYGNGDKKKKVVVTKTSESEKQKQLEIERNKLITAKNNEKYTSSKSDKETLIATSTVSVTKNTVEDYINLYSHLAMQSMKNYGIPASIKLAQGILESGSGNGTLCRTANNHFGIKCKEEWLGDSVSHTDDAPNECFRKYKNALESYNDHSEFLANRVYYRNLFNLDKADYKAWAKGLKQSGYATDPQYPQKLISIIERYKLYEFDNQVLSLGGVTPVRKINQDNVTQNSTSYIVQPGDTLYAISQKFNSSVDRLKELNNLSDTSLSVGQKLVIQ